MKDIKKRKIRYKNLMIIIAPLLIVLGITVVLGVKSIGDVSQGNSAASKPMDSIDSMDYHLIDKATEIQIEEFQKLSDAVTSGDDKAIAESVVRNYVADFYTWTNKATSYDIGGLYYVYSPQKVQIYMQARDTFYKHLNSYIEDYGSGDLLEVESMETTVTKSEEDFVIDDIKYDNYYVECSWKYKETKDFDTSRFDTKGYFNVIKKENGRFEIVVSYGDN